MGDFPTQEEWDKFLQAVTDAFRELRGIGSATEVRWQAGITSDDTISLKLAQGETHRITRQDWPAF